MKTSPPAALLACVLLIAATSAFGQGNPRCDGCGRIITDEYLTIEDRYYHPDHFVCDHCLKSIRDDYIRYNLRNYHHSCYREHVVVACALCNRAIDGEYRKDRWGNVYHAGHFAEETACAFCERLIFGGFAAGRRRFPDGRELCGQCAATSVTTAQAAESLVARVARSLEQDGVHIDTGNITILLLGRDRMQLLSPDPSRHLQGFTDYASPLDVRARTEFTGANIWLLNGMPEVQMMSIIAHELMHVWQGSHGSLALDPATYEGSANYAEYLVMQRAGSREAQFIMERMNEDQDPVYGEGFRRMKLYAEEHGISGLLKLLTVDNPVMSGEH